MSTITFGAELLRQPFQEKALEEAQGFAAVYDLHSRPVIFCARKNGQLLLLSPTAEGRVEVVDLGKKLGLTDQEKVKCFAVSQTRDSAVYLTFSTSTNNNSDKLWVLEPLKPDVQDWYSKYDSSKVISGEQRQDLKISKLMLSKTLDYVGYPFLVAEVQVDAKLTKDVARVNVECKSDHAGKWNWATDLEFPYNVERIKDMCPGTIYGASGVFAIDDTQATPSLTFVGVRKASAEGLPRQPYVAHLPVVAKAQAVATTVDIQGYSNVLVAGDGILHIPAKECSTPKRKGVVAASLTNEALLGISRLQLTQNGRKVSIWAQNGDNNLVGQIAKLITVEDDDSDDVDAIAADGSPVPLIPGANFLQTFDAVIDPSSDTLEVFTLAQSGSVSRLKQNGDTKLWSEAVFRIPDPEDVVDINTYACQIRLLGENGDSLPETEIRVRASSETSVSANGLRLHIGPSDTKLKTDSRGMLALILPAPNLTVPDITVSAVGAITSTFNPANKAIEKLCSAASSGKLEKAKGPDGSPMFKDLKASDKKALAQLGTLYNEKRAAQPASAQGVSLSSLEAASTGERGVLWHLWHGIVSGVEEVLSFVYEAGKFVIKTVKRVITFVIETVEHVLSAIWGLLKWLLGDLIEHFLEWLAEFLDWDGITDCMLFFNETFNVGIDLIQELIAEGSEKVDATFQEFEETIGAWHVPPTLPENIARSRPQPRKDDSKTKSMTSDPLFNWASNQIESDDSKERLTSAGKKGDKTGVPGILQSLFEEIFLPLWDNFKDTLSAMWTDAKKLFDSNSNMTWQDILKNVGTDFILGIVRGVRKLIHGILAISSDLLSWIKTIMNQPVDIWVVSKVFKKVTKGEELTMLKLCSLILALPTHYMFKLIYGKKPREVPQIAELFDELRRSPRKTETDMSAKEDASPSSNFEPKSNPVVPVTLGADSMIKTGPQARSAALKIEPVGQSAISTSTAIEKTYATSSMIKMQVLSTTETKTSSDSPTVGRLKWLFRLGMFLKNVGKLIYTIIDCIATGFFWPGLKRNNDRMRDEKPVLEKNFSWTRALGIFFSIVVTATDFPYLKFGRSTLGTTTRILTWAVVGVLNFLKACIREMQKPALAAVAGVVDIIGYSVVLYAEHPNGDGPLEWSQRYLTNLWAIGSCYNSITGAKEPYGLGITIVVGVAMNVEATILAMDQANYFQDHGWDEKYNPPSFHTGLSGSLF